jgi:hypothetical protein
MRATAGFRHVCGLKGHESIAQALAWVCISNRSALKGRQKIVLHNVAEFRCTFEAKTAKNRSPSILKLER